ncbi:hypothetical protein BDZ91DRAFT_81664 [Kalaharituber pfeilii]|nr:hypothetical protein BDZ91DRAFT_81664 [Kalaharituber pfeilii]
MESQVPAGTASAEEEWEPAVWKILETMRDHNMDMATLFERMMKSSSPRLKQKTGVFFAKDGFQRVFEAMLPHMEFDPKKRSLNSARSVIELKQRMGVSLWKLIHVVLESKLRSYCNNIETRMGVGHTTPETARSFSLDELKAKFEERCPRLFGIMQVVCQGNSSGHAIDGEKLGTDDGNRNRGIISIVVMYMLAFARSRRCNTFQSMVGYYLQGNTVSKRSISFLNQVELSVSYTSICKTMRSMGLSNLKNIQKRIWEVS